MVNRTFTDISGPDRAKQSFKDECDINRIVKQFKDTGQVTHVRDSQGEYGFATAQTFDEAMRIVANANSQFALLPSKVRAHFDNDPAKFLDASQDDARRPEFVELGLLEALPEPEPEIPPEASQEPSPPPAE